MGNSKTTELAFEEAMEHHLLNEAGYVAADPANFDRERALDSTVFIPFIRETQPKVWASLEGIHGTETAAVVLDDLGRDISEASAQVWSDFVINVSRTLD